MSPSGPVLVPVLWINIDISGLMDALPAPSPPHGPHGSRGGPALGEGEGLALALFSSLPLPSPAFIVDGLSFGTRLPTSRDRPGGCFGPGSPTGTPPAPALGSTRPSVQLIAPELLSCSGSNSPVFSLFPPLFLHYFFPLPLFFGGKEKQHSPPPLHPLIGSPRL